MKYSEAKLGRTFVIRLEDGDILHESVERFAAKRSITAATLIAVGGADSGSELVVGPKDGRANPVTPMGHAFEDVHEVAGVGTIFPNEKGDPILHMHVACGRGDRAVAGCVRRGVKVWHVLEIVLTELTDTSATRVLDSATGFELLRP